MQEEGLSETGTRTHDRFEIVDQLGKKRHFVRAIFADLTHWENTMTPLSN